MGPNETADPHAALGARDVPTRCAGCRDLGRKGTWDDLPRLVALVAADKSMGVRLNAAGAATDIAMRERAAGRVDAERADRLHAWLQGVDPARAPTILMLASAAGDKRAVERLGRLLRDPRNLVRAGAIVALRRLVVSHTAVGRLDLEAAAEGWFQGSPADVVAELVRLMGEVGWARPMVRVTTLDRSPGTAIALAVDEAVERHRLRAHPTFRLGLWISDGRDVFGVHPDPGPRTWLVVGAEQVWTAEGCEPLRWDDGVGFLPRGPLRLIWGGQVGVPARQPAMQRIGRTYWAVPARSVLAALDDDALGLSRIEPDGALALDGALEAVEGQGDGDPGLTLARGRLRLLAGDAAGATAWLRRAVEHRKARSEAMYWLGIACQRIGPSADADARAAFTAFLERSKGRSELRAEATRRLAGLGDGVARSPAGSYDSPGEEV